MKSVPPLVALAIRQTAIATALSRPPNTATSRVSVVTV